MCVYTPQTIGALKVVHDSQTLHRPPSHMLSPPREGKNGALRDGSDGICGICGIGGIIGIEARTQKLCAGARPAAKNSRAMASHHSLRSMTPILIVVVGGK